LNSDSIPPWFGLRSKHLRVHIRAAIPQHLIIFIPIALPTRVGEIEIGVNNLFFCGTRGSPDRPARVADYDALAIKQLAALDTDAICRCNEYGVGVCRRHAQDV